MNKNIKAFGYSENGEELIKLKEITIECTLSDLDRIIDFLIYARKSHGIELNGDEICHSHFQDWSKDWESKDADIIVVTRNDNE